MVLGRIHKKGFRSDRTSGVGGYGSSAVLCLMWTFTGRRNSERRMEKVLRSRESVKVSHDGGLCCNIHSAIPRFDNLPLRIDSPTHPESGRLAMPSIKTTNLTKMNALTGTL